MKRALSCITILRNIMSTHHHPAFAAKWSGSSAEGIHVGSAQSQSKESGNGDSDAHTAPRDAKC